MIEKKKDLIDCYYCDLHGRLHSFSICISECIEDEEENGPYQGKFIGSLNSFHHQVSGKVYAVDEYTFLLSGFNYDGNGADTFFWAGASNRPGPQGFIVPDEYGKYVFADSNKKKTLTLLSTLKIIQMFVIKTQTFLFPQNQYSR